MLLNKKYCLIFLVITIIVVCGMTMTSATDIQDSNHTQTRNNNDKLSTPDNYDVDKMVQSYTGATGKDAKVENRKTNTQTKNTENTRNAVNTENTKQITKNTGKSTIKQDTQLITVNNYDELKYALTINAYPNMTVTLDGEGAIYTSTGLITVNTTIKNLTINGNYKTIDGASQRFLTLSNINITFNQLTVKNCKSSSGNGGGAIYSTGTCYITINESAFENNVVTTYYGGALYLAGKSIVTINNSNFTDNSEQRASGYGGAIYQQGASSELYINNSKFGNNSLASGSSNGGAIFQGQNGKIIIDNSLFSENRANYYGGAIYQYNGGQLFINNSNFTSNQAQNRGGAITNQQSVSAIIHNTNFISNKALKSGAGHGGAIFASNDIELFNCTFQSNTATNCGGAIRVDCQLEADSCSFVENQAPQGAAIAQPATYSRTSDIIIKNSNFTKNRATSYGIVHAFSTSGGVLAENSNFNENWGDQHTVFYINNTNENNISYCNFTNNTVNKYGIINVINITNLSIKYSNLTSNYAGSGSILGSESFLSLENNTFDSNWIGSNSVNDWIIKFDNVDSKVVNNTFFNNTNNYRDMLINTLVNEIHDNYYIDNYLNDTLEIADATISGDYQQEIDVILRNVYNDTIRNGTVELYINDNPTMNKCGD